MTKRPRKQWLFTLLTITLLVVYARWMFVDPLAPKVRKITLTPAADQPTVVLGDWHTYHYDGEIEDMVMDDDGVIWTASRGAGITAWDLESGEFRQYGPEHGLASNYMTGISIASDGRIWAISEYSGVSVFDGDIWETTRSVDGIPIERLRSIATGPEGHVWISGDGIFFYDGQVWTVNTLDTWVNEVYVTESGRVFSTLNEFSEWDGETWQPFPTPMGMIYDIASTPDDVLWLHSSHLLSKYENGIWTTFTPDDIDHKDSYLWKIDVTNDGTVWVGTSDHIVRFDGQSWRKIAKADSLDAMVAADSNNVLWASKFAWDNSELFLYADGEHRVYTLGNVPQLLDAGIRKGISFDANDGIWVSLGYKGELNMGKWNHDSRQAYEWESVSMDIRKYIQDIVPASDGTVWIQEPAWIWQWHDGDTQSYKICDRKYQGFRYDDSEDIAIAEDDSVWVSCGTGLAHYVAGEWEYIAAPDVEGTMYDIAIEGDFLFVAISKGYLSVYNVITHEWYISDMFHERGIRLLNVADGKIWVATAESGVYTMNYAEDKGLYNVQRYTQDDGLASNEVQAIDVLSDNPVVWFGTKQGATCFDGANWTTYTTEQGLASNDVYGITHGPDGMVWFVTEYGISQFDAGLDTGRCPQP